MKNAAIALFLAALASTLHADLRSQVETGTGWVGYSVPIVSGRHMICSYDSMTVGDWDDKRFATALVVLFYVENGKIETVRMASPECPLDKPVRKLGAVDGRESARYLLSLINRDSSMAKKALGALALHAGAEDDLISLARNHPDSHVRSHALFWISQRAGEKAASVLRQAVNDDPEEDVRAKAVFAISQLPDDQSIPMLIDLINTHRNAKVRKKAAFWLGQKDDPRALAALEDILRR